MKINIKRIALLAIFAGAFMSSCTEDEFLTEEEVGTHHSYLKTENVPTSTESFALTPLKILVIPFISTTKSPMISLPNNKSTMYKKGLPEDKHLFYVRS